MDEARGEKGFKFTEEDHKQIWTALVTSIAEDVAKETVAAAEKDWMAEGERLKKWEEKEKNKMNCLNDAVKKVRNIFQTLAPDHNN